jgi:hypothetical protein
MANNRIRIKRKKQNDGTSAPPANDNSFKWGEIAYNEDGGILYYGGGSGDANQDNASRILPIAGSGQYVLRDGSNATGVWQGLLDEENKIDSEITSTITLGGIPLGQTFTSGTSIATILTSLLVTNKHPAVDEPTISFTTNGFTINGTAVNNNANLEVGTTGTISATIQYSQGLIRGRGTCVTWNTSLSQTGVGGVDKRRGGATSSVTFDGVQQSVSLTQGQTTTRTITLNASRFINDGNNSFGSATATFLAGTDIALDCNGNASTQISPNPSTGGTTSPALSRLLVGRRKYFYQFSTTSILSNTTSAHIRALTNNVLPTSNNFAGGGLDLTLPAGMKSIVIAYPSTWGNLSVVDQASNLSYTANISSSLDGYYQTTVSVEGLNGLGSTNYKVYTYTPALFENEAVHIIRIV